MEELLLRRFQTTGLLVVGSSPAGPPYIPERNAGEPCSKAKTLNSCKYSGFYFDQTAFGGV